MKPKNPRGQKKAFTIAQAIDLSDRLVSESQSPHATEIQIRNAALFRVSLCSMLRASDILNLRLIDVWDFKSGVRQEFTIIQKKTKDPVTCYLSELTIKVLSRWLHDSCGSSLYVDKERTSSEILEQVSNYKVFNISDRQYRNIVQSWAKKIGLDPKLYSTHSMRRTKPKEIYAKTRNIKALKILLGHRHINTTALYLGVEQDEVEDLVRKTKIGE